MLFYVVLPTSAHIVVAILNIIVQHESGVTVLNNIADNNEQLCGQHRLMNFCHVSN